MPFYASYVYQMPLLYYTVLYSMPRKYSFIKINVIFSDFHLYRNVWLKSFDLSKYTVQHIYYLCCFPQIIYNILYNNIMNNVCSGGLAVGPELILSAGWLLNKHRGVKWTPYHNRNEQEAPPHHRTTAPLHFSATAPLNFRDNQDKSNTSIMQEKIRSKKCWYTRYLFWILKFVFKYPGKIKTEF